MLKEGLKEELKEGQADQRILDSKSKNSLI
jgi:hypothetical protein